MKTLFKWLIGIFLILLLLVFGAGWYFSRNWKPLVEKELKRVVQESTQGLYSLKYRDLNLNVALGTASLLDAELIPDSLVYQQQVQEQIAPNTRYHIQMKELRVERFNIWDVLKNRTLFIRRISFSSPKIHMISQRQAYNDTLVNRPRQTLYDNIKHIFSAINVRDIEVQDVSFTYSQLQNGKYSELALDSVGIFVHDVLLDETSMSDSSRIFYTKRVEVVVPGFSYETSDGFYKTSFDRMVLNTEQENVLFTQVKFVPKMEQDAYFRARKADKMLLDLQVDTLRFEHLDFKAMIDNQQLISRKLQIKNGAVLMANDRRFPRSQRSKVGRSPHQLLLKLDQLIRIDQLNIDSVDLAYQLHSQKYNQKGIIRFQNTSGTIRNLTNDSLALLKNDKMQADFTSWVMGTGRLNIHFDFDLLSNDGHHHYKGSLGAMKATAFNKILTPLLRAEISSGNIRSINFDMQGNDYRNWGDLSFRYDHMKLGILPPPGQSRSKLKSGMLSFLINSVLINDSNPDANDRYHSGKVNYRRQAQHSFFKNIWESLLDGIKQSAGISAEREAKLVAGAERAKNVQQKTKSAAKKTGEFFGRLFKKKDKEKDES